MESNIFEYLPLEITTNILSRLSIRSLAISKSVCKPWLNLIALLTPKERDSTQCTIFEIEDEVDAEKSHDLLHCIPLMDFDIPHRNREFMEGITANGLLLLCSPLKKGIPLYICNLITREYTELRCPVDYIPPHVFKFRFGVSKISGEYKVLGINRLRGSDSEHRVYTLGTGTWRRVEAGAASSFRFWGVFDLSDTDNVRICGFDVETECFRIFSVPPVEDGVGNWDLSVLRDCVCYTYTRNNEVVIWMMKEYQVEDSWTIEYKLSTIGFDFDFDFDLDYICILPFKHFTDGDILMLLDEIDVICYSNKTRTFQRVDMFKDAATVYRTALIFTPSFFSINNFGFENVFSF